MLAGACLSAARRIADVHVGQIPGHMRRDHMAIQVRRLRRFSVNDGGVVGGVRDTDSWKTSDGPPWSRAICVITAEMLPPAESWRPRSGRIARPGSTAWALRPRAVRPCVVEACGRGARGPVGSPTPRWLQPDGVGAGHIVGVESPIDQPPPW